MSYDNFAQTFSKSRIDHPWPELDYLIDIMSEKGVASILDVGCGNGRFIEHYEKSQKNSPLSLCDIPPRGGGQGKGDFVSSPLLGGGEGGVPGGISPVLDDSGYHHRLAYLRGNTEKAKQLRKEMTTPEKKLWYDFLRDHSPRWYRQYPIDTYIVDFYCPKNKLIIELDGESHVGREEYDALRTEILEQYGLRVIRFTNQDIMMRFEGVCGEIQDCIETTPPCHFVTSPLGEGGIQYLGIDSSSGMIEEARRLHPRYEFEVCDMLALGEYFRHREERSDVAIQVPEDSKTLDCFLHRNDRKSFDCILFLASFHHLETREERLQVLEDMKPYLAPGGEIMMTNWNLRDQPRYEKSHRGDGDFDIKIGAFARYYHGFTLDELEGLFIEAGYQIVENRVFEGGRNIVSRICLDTTT